MILAQCAPLAAKRVRVKTIDRVQYVRAADKRPPSIVRFVLFWVYANALFSTLVGGYTFICS